MKMGLWLSLFFLFSCSNTKIKPPEEGRIEKVLERNGVQLVVLGTIQDAGSPHIACIKDCCKDLIKNPDKTRKVVSLGLVDNKNKQTFLFEATPDMPAQLKLLAGHAKFQARELSNGVFLTHAHIGHYSGLMYLGKEATDAAEVPVYAMPRMDSFLRNNGPWSQLVNNQNIYLKRIHHLDTIRLTSSLSVIPLKVPHRDEYSETVGYKILGPENSVLFIPDIDKWSKWDLDIKKEITSVDIAFVDATFYDGDEIKARDLSQIPHPFVVETMAELKDLKSNDRNKVHFIHFNHTNPLLKKGSEEEERVIQNGFRIAQFNSIFYL